MDTHGGKTAKDKGEKYVIINNKENTLESGKKRNSTEMLELRPYEQSELIPLDELQEPDSSVATTEIIPKTTLKNKIKNTLRVMALSILTACVVGFMIVFFASNKVQYITIVVLTWLEHLTLSLSVLFMIGLYSIALVFFCPGTPFNLAAGFLYGIWLGAFVALTGCILGACIAFLLGRTIAREWVKNKVEKTPRFRAVDWAIQRNGVYIVFLTRLSPLFPFPLLNYAFGITKVSILSYVSGTALGVLPGTIAYTYLGTLMRNLADMWTNSATSQTSWSATKIAGLIIGSTVTIISILVISWITKSAISKATSEYEKMYHEPDKFENRNLVTFGKKDLEKSPLVLNV